MVNQPLEIAFVPLVAGSQVRASWVRGAIGRRAAVLVHWLAGLLGLLGHQEGSRRPRARRTNTRFTASTMSLQLPDQARPASVAVISTTSPCRSPWSRRT